MGGRSKVEGSLPRRVCLCGIPGEGVKAKEREDHGATLLNYEGIRYVRLSDSHEICLFSPRY